MNAIIIALMVWLTMHLADCDYRAANVLAYIIAQIHNFLWCKYWIFPLDADSKKNSLIKQVTYFMVAFLVAYLAQFLFLLVAVEVFHCNEYLAQFLGLFIYGAANFLGNRFITFQ